jgi:hypothetical protein
MNMKHFNKMAAQGDFVIIRINKLPENIVPFDSEDGKYVIAHSETGHNHVMDAANVLAYKPEGLSDKDIFELFLSVNHETEIEHLRTYDTHESILVQPGDYVVKRQREWTSEGWRKAQD